jgi:hypothetical protein
MDMLTDFNQQIIPNYSPISARGGSRRRRRSKKRLTRRHKKSNTYSKNGRTRRRYR